MPLLVDHQDGYTRLKQSPVHIGRYPGGSRMVGFQPGQGVQHDQIAEVLTGSHNLERRADLRHDQAVQGLVFQGLEDWQADLLRGPQPEHPPVSLGQQAGQGCLPYLWPAQQLVPAGAHKFIHSLSFSCGLYTLPHHSFGTAPFTDSHRPSMTEGG